MRHRTAIITTTVILLIAGLLGVVNAQERTPPPTAVPPQPQPIEPVQPGVFTDPSWLKIDYQRVNVTIDSQIATTEVDMKFTNQGDGLAEGTFLFPLPEEATVEELTMFVDGDPIRARVLPADEARGIYDEIVRQYRDPALLEYVGRSAIQANVFPIPPGESRRITFSYGQALEVDNGLVHYTFPMNQDALSSRDVAQISVNVEVQGNDPIGTIYSPSHEIATFRPDDDRTRFTTGWEATNYSDQTDDFSLYYGISNETISANVLSFKEGANRDGFFMLMLQPPLSVPDEQAIPKDVIVVLDQSGSMAEGNKWNQARDAAAFVLDNLKPRDRFNVVVFSNGVRTYSTQMEAPEQADDATSWLDGLYAEGGTDINGALTNAFDLAKQARDDRPTSVIFLTDGLPTVGETAPDAILENAEATAGRNTRVFTFGVGNDVDTFLLDQLAGDFGGASSYVRPTERIDEEVASLYSKISAPVLTDAELSFDGAQVDLTYPQGITDLFAGEQITLVGRYREGTDDLTVRLSGQVNGEPEAFSYEGFSLRERAGGESFIARLWATRRIGDLLNTIRLNGESEELVDSVVSLSVRYGIITPYTSFLIDEDDILSQQGRARAAREFQQDEAANLSRQSSGESAVEAADAIGGLSEADAAPSTAPSPAPTGTASSNQTFSAESQAPGENEEAPAQPATQGGQIKTVQDKTFILRDGVWTDTAYETDTMETEQVTFLSDAYFDLLDEHPELGEYFALGEHVIVVYEDTAYEVLPE